MGYRADGRLALGSSRRSDDGGLKDRDIAAVGRLRMAEDNDLFEAVFTCHPGFWELSAERHYPTSFTSP
jgi:hypothetical protein